MHFGENQLSRSLIGLSPLTTGHPPTFQRWWVRPSTRSYPRFSLPMARSLRFGSRACDSNALFRLAFATAPPHGLTSPHATNSQAHSSKGTPSPLKAPTDCRHTVSGTISRPLTGALFTFPSRYWSAIGHQEVFSLTTWSWQIHTGFHGPRATWVRAPRGSSDFVYGTPTLYGPALTPVRLSPCTHTPGPADPGRHAPRPR